MRARLLAAAALALSPAVAAHAGGTVTYGSDAKGRLTDVAHAGGPSNGASAAYRFDAADNRTGVLIRAAHSFIVVVPLNGMTVIPVG